MGKEKLHWSDLWSLQRVAWENQNRIVQRNKQEKQVIEQLGEQYEVLTSFFQVLTFLLKGCSHWAGYYQQRQCGRSIL